MRRLILVLCFLTACGEEPRIWRMHARCYSGDTMIFDGDYLVRGPWSYTIAGLPLFLPEQGCVRERLS